MKTTIFRKPTDDEIRVLEAAGNRADDWSAIEVTDGFATSQMTGCRLHGHVRIGRNTVLRNSEVRNYDIGDNVIIESVTALECRCESSFGNGVKVATMNENEGRSVTIYEGLTAQAGYLAAVYRHRSHTVARLTEMAEAIAAAHRSHIGHIGDGSRISGARFIRETNIGRNVTIDGCSVLQNGTVGDDSFIGVDVKAYDFITAQGVHIDNGSIIERCFIGEAVIMDKGFSASESLFFANSHCENGEAASIFAGPYTVSHHKSTLLIAGMFSFFNAGSGSNQSNHLFKSGAVHQSVHLRGCKFASGAYIMSPAIEAPFTMVLGHHSRHHDIADLPYSYLIENNGRSMLIPGANLTSYGTVRDIEKWPKRDKRRVGGDIINFEEYNPYITGKLIRGLNILNTLKEENPETELYGYNKVFIKAANLRKGISLYNKCIVASLGAMLRDGRPSGCDGRGEWVDLAGQFITKRAVGEILEALESGEIATPEELGRRFGEFAANYADYAYSWAADTLAKILGHTPDEEELKDTVTSAENIHASLRKMTDNDRRNDCSMEMSVGYGIDCDSADERALDYRVVRGLD